MRRVFESRGFSAVSFLIILAALAVVGGGVYYLWIESSHQSTESSLSESPEAVSATVAAAPTTVEFRSSLPKLVARGDTLECDWRAPDSDGSNPYSTGKLWTMGNQGRSMITTKISDTSVEANALYKDNVAYTWMKMGNISMGFRFSQDSLSEANAQMTADQRKQAEQIQQEMIYMCRAWNPDPAMFRLPADVEFKEM